MRAPTIDERFVDFLEGPSLERWLAVREQLMSRSDFEPYSPLWRQLEAEFAAGSHGRVLQISARLGRIGCLSPRFHFLSGVAALETGDFSRANWEKTCTRSCLEAIFETGSGTWEDPYLSTYPGDCYDVLMALGVAPRGQKLIDREGIWCDVLTADDGGEYWFDVTDLLERNVASGDRRVARQAYLAAGRLV